MGGAEVGFAQTKDDLDEEDHAFAQLNDQEQESLLAQLKNQEETKQFAQLDCAIDEDFDQTLAQAES